MTEVTAPTPFDVAVVDIATRAQDLITQREKDIRKELQNAINEHNLLAMRLREATEEFIHNGVGYADRWLDHTLNQLANVKTSSYFLDLAREHERPYIYAVEENWRYRDDTLVELRVPRTQRLS